ncbi:hypothetical protein LX64_00176 [Chitinophaga skermanii]|uniref:Uncharacterized protein n=1 Tax=Chitinophaga skermanii TaxID=331697 RepID=A0A327R3N5_9BACT|nr:hypothetical protein [Chitinophaga skermanii]RAJ10572.1 hypothetical protein LX64_00176 [Chitinophaga skermanii]
MLTHIADSKNQQNVPQFLGVGGGTLLISLANNLPDTNVYKSWLIIIAPSITMFIAFCWKLIFERMTKHSTKVKVKEQDETWQQYSNDLLNDPHLSEKFKKKVQAKVEEYKFDRLKSLQEKILSNESKID